MQERLARAAYPHRHAPLMPDPTTGSGAGSSRCSREPGLGPYCARVSGREASALLSLRRLCSPQTTTLLILLRQPIFLACVAQLAALYFVIAHCLLFLFLQANAALLIGLRTLAKPSFVPCPTPAIPYLPLSISYLLTV